MAFNVVFFLSLLTLHNICAIDFTEPKDESILEIIKHADAEEGIHSRRNFKAIYQFPKYFWSKS
jgi:hypothetical protein